MGGCGLPWEHFSDWGGGASSLEFCLLTPIIPRAHGTSLFLLRLKPCRSWPGTSALEEGSGQSALEPSPPLLEQALVVRIACLAQRPRGVRCRPRPAEELLSNWPRLTSSPSAFRGCLHSTPSVGPKITGSQKAADLQLSRWSQLSSEVGVVGRLPPPVSCCLSWSKLTPCRSLSGLLWEVTAAKSRVSVQCQLPGTGQALAELQLLVLIPWLQENARPITKRRVSISRP